MKGMRYQSSFCLAPQEINNLNTRLKVNTPQPCRDLGVQDRVGPCELPSDIHILLVERWSEMATLALFRVFTGRVHDEKREGNQALRMPLTLDGSCFI